MIHHGIPEKFGAIEKRVLTFSEKQLTILVDKEPLSLELDHFYSIIAVIAISKNNQSS